MAWFNNSPEIEQQKQFTTKEARRTVLTKNTGRWNFFLKIPFLNSIYLYYGVRLLSKKLNTLEQRIHSHSLENLSAVLALLRQLFQLTTLLKQKQLSSKDNSKIRDRVEQLKKYLIQKSHGAMITLSKQKSSDTTQFVSSHKQLLNLMKEPETLVNTTKNYYLQGKLYWKYIPTPIVNIKPLATVASFKTDVHYFLHTTFNMLVNLLKNNINNPLNVQNLAEIKLSQSCFSNSMTMDPTNPLVCGISFKKSSSSLFNINQNPKPNFWQTKQTEKNLEQFILPEIIKDNRLAQHVTNIFFQTQEDYSKFKHLIHDQKDSYLLDLLNSIEQERQVQIYEGKFVEESLTI